MSSLVGQVIPFVLAAGMGGHWGNLSNDFGTGRGLQKFARMLFARLLETCLSRAVV